MNFIYTHRNILYLHFKTQHIIWQQLQSFDSFIFINLKKIIYNSKCVNKNKQGKITYKFTNLEISNPVNSDKSTDCPVTPHECRVRDSSYTALVFVKIFYRLEKKKFFQLNLILCRIPIMIRSRKCITHEKGENYLFKIKECPFDSGGYFIINGTEKIVSIREKLSSNKINIEKDEKKNTCAVILSCYLEKRVKNSIVLKKKKIYFRSNIFLEDILVFIIFKAFGFDCETDIIQFIGSEFEDTIEDTLHETRIIGVVTQRQAFFYIYRRINFKLWKNKINFQKNSSKTHQLIKKIVLDIFSKYILIHLTGVKVKGNFFYPKIIFISIMIRKMITSIDELGYFTDKDYYGNKRIDLAGQTIFVLFQNLFEKTIYEMEKKYIIFKKKLKKKTKVNLLDLFHSDVISKGIEYSLSTGNWVVNKFTRNSHVICQVLSRLSFISSISMINRVNSTYEKTRKNTGPRSLHPSQWGALCPSDTPEGESCGLVKNLSILAHVTVNEKTKHILKICFDLGINLLNFLEKNLTRTKGKAWIVLNGKCIGFHLSPPRFLFIFREMRRNGIISQNISICWDTINQLIMIWTDGGRINRPLFVIKSGYMEINKKFFKKKNIKLVFWKNLQRERCIDLLDINEQSNALIANELKNISLKTTHAEISKEIILGISANTIPFPDHNQSPRNTYQCAMGKQAIGSIAFNQNYRTDAVLSLLYYPQKPITKTKMSVLLGNHILTGGANVCVCIMSYKGYDMEDAIILNHSSVQRGIFRNNFFRKIKFLLKQNKGDNLSNSHGSRDFFITEQLSIVFKKNKIKYKQQKICFFSWKKYQKEQIHNVILTTDGYGLIFIKFMLRQLRIPEIGDKFSSRHGQKGICGLIVFQNDFPFSNEGTTPDFIMNPHGFPSRMTIGKMIEMIVSKLSCLIGKFSEGASFINFKSRVNEKKIKNLGYSKTCKDFLFSGISGCPLRKFVFCGSVFYQKLKHMVTEKIHARSRGIKSSLTRQPIEGRNKGGGLRFGEMERDCLVTYGACELTIERLMISSDVFLANFDTKRGIITYSNSAKKCITFLKFPYACKLLFQELYAMNISPRICFESCDYDKFIK